MLMEFQPASENELMDIEEPHDSNEILLRTCLIKSTELPGDQELMVNEKIEEQNINQDGGPGKMEEYDHSEGVKKIKQDKNLDPNVGEFFNEILQFHLLNSIPYDIGDDVILDLTENLILSYLQQI